MNGKLLSREIETSLDNNFLFDVNDDLSVSIENIVRWSVSNPPPLTIEQAMKEYDKGAYPIALYIYTELLVQGTNLNQMQRKIVNSLLDTCLDLNKVYLCLSEILKIMDRLRRDSFYLKGLYQMGIAQSLNNIITREFNPKAISMYPVYIRLQKTIIKFFKLSVTTLMGCNLELEFDVVNTLNYNLAKIEINYGIILTSPDILAIPSCKEYKLVGEKALRMSIARLSLLFNKDPDKKYLVSISRVFEILNEKDKSRQVLKSAVKLNDTDTDMANISIMAKKKRDRSYKHRLQIYTNQ